MFPRYQTFYMMLTILPSPSCCCFYLHSKNAQQNFFLGVCIYTHIFLISPPQSNVHQERMHLKMQNVLHNIMHPSIVCQICQIGEEVRIDCCNGLIVTETPVEHDGFPVPSTLNQLQLSKQHTLNAEATEE